MRFCVNNNERQGSCYFEFQKGTFNGTYWVDNNLCLSADYFDALNLYRLFEKVLPDFDYYGENHLTKDQWLLIECEAEKIGGDVKEVIAEISTWVNTVLPNESIISVLGL